VSRTGRIEQIWVTVGRFNLTGSVVGVKRRRWRTGDESRLQVRRYFTAFTCSKTPEVPISRHASCRPLDVIQKKKKKRWTFLQVCGPGPAGSLLVLLSVVEQANFNKSIYVGEWELGSRIKVFDNKEF
jgi:hypothetical protein